VFSVAVNLGFLNGSRYFPFEWLLNYLNVAEWTPFQAHYSENLIAPEIESGTFGFVAWNSAH
jgi:hypothetical protein